MKSNNSLKLFLLAVIASGCGKSDKKDSTPPAEIVPNVCKSLSVVGTFPINGQPNQDTYAVACFEGYLMQFDKKRYLADSKCGDAKLLVASGDEQAKKYFEPIESKSCPLVDAIAVCDMTTAKTVVYKESQEFFKKEAFEAYCKENGGTTLYK